MTGDDAPPSSGRDAAFEARYERLLDELDHNGFIDAIPTMEFLFRRECRCSCHPQLGTHDHGGYGCPCEQTPEQRRRAWDDFEEGMSAFWESEEYRAWEEADAAAMAAATEWAATHGVVAERVTMAAPEQWVGTVDGVPFYFRERHGSWRLEVDATRSDRGPVIAEGSESDYATPVELLTIIADAIRLHTARGRCEHPIALAFCADCGLRLR